MTSHTFDTSFLLLDVVLPTRFCHPRVACLRHQVLLICWHVHLVLDLTLHCQWRTRRGTRHLDRDMNCFLEHLETGCCLRNLIVFGTKLRMLVLPDVRGLRDARDRFNNALCHRARCLSVAPNCSVKSGIDPLCAS